MPRMHTVGYRRWVEAADGKDGYYEFIQEDIPFTAEEETERDAEEALDPERIAAVRAKRDKKTQLRNKLGDDTITDSEIRELLRLEHGFD